MGQWKLGTAVKLHSVAPGDGIRRMFVEVRRPATVTGTLIVLLGLACDGDSERQYTIIEAIKECGVEGAHSLAIM